MAPIDQQRDEAIRYKAAAILQGAPAGGKGGRLKRLLPFLGPAFVAAIAYVDPGNFATNIAAGSAYGYTLLWVIVAANLMGMLIQILSAKLGIATGRNLAEICRDNLPRPLVWVMWVLMEGVAMATDLAEFLGAALGFNLLFGMPLLWGAILATIATFLILMLERRGFRHLEAVIAVMLGTVALCYVFELGMGGLDWGATVHGALVPAFPDSEAILLATGILGATVMPHAIYLHSSLVQHRIAADTDEAKRKLFRFTQIDATVAMVLAGFVNAAMLVMAAATFWAHGHTGIGSIEVAHLTLAPLLGKASQTVFALSLLASGLSSTVVGTIAGQVIMQGFLHVEIPIWVRRLVTLAPAFVVILIGLDPTRTLVISQVILSLGLPFAVVPLVWFTGQKRLMGALVNRPVTKIVAWVVTGLILALNSYLLFSQLA
ncbi:MAG TPA: Nramp family divalent metal transporter [Symbiobacteriaceae bacterium]|nr:Nramp family divalent metal transporter [Symbiobacteriaceae bacterium]